MKALSKESCGSPVRSAQLAHAMSREWPQSQRWNKMEKKGTWENWQRDIYTNGVLCQQPSCAQERFRVAIHRPISQPAPADNLGMSRQLYRCQSLMIPKKEKLDEQTTESAIAEGI